MLAGSHRNAWPDETGTGGRTNRNTHGLQLSLKHVDYLLNPSPFNSCSFFPDFPAWLPLDVWFPWWFKPLAECSERQWNLLGWELPQWLVLIFSVYLIIWVVIVAANLLTHKYLAE